MISTISVQARIHPDQIWPLRHRITCKPQAPSQSHDMMIPSQHYEACTEYGYQTKLTRPNKKIYESSCSTGCRGGGEEGMGRFDRSLKPITAQRRLDSCQPGWRDHMECGKCSWKGNNGFDQEDMQRSFGSPKLSLSKGRLVERLQCARLGQKSLSWWTVDRVRRGPGSMILDQDSKYACCYIASIA